MTDFTQDLPIATPVDGPLELTSPVKTEPSPDQSAADNSASSGELEAAPAPKPKAESQKILKAAELFRLNFRFEQLTYSDLLAGENSRTGRDLEAKTSLKESMSRSGILEPLIVYPDDELEKYIIIAGHGRYEVAGELGMETLPCMVADRKPSPAAILMLARDENDCHEHVRPMDRARHFEKLFEAAKAEGLASTQKELAALLGRTTQSQISTYLKLLKLDLKDQERVQNGELSVKDATRNGKAKPTAAAKGQKASGKSKVSKAESRRGQSLKVERSWPDAETGLEIQVHAESGKMSLENLVWAVRRWLKALEAELAGENRK